MAQAAGSLTGSAVDRVGSKSGSCVDRVGSKFESVVDRVRSKSESAQKSGSGSDRVRDDVTMMSEPGN